MIEFLIAASIASVVVALRWWFQRVQDTVASQAFVEQMISDFHEHVFTGYSEQHGDVIRLYSKKHEFLCQGRSLTELSRAFSQRYPSKRFVVEPGDYLYALLVEFDQETA